MAACLIQDIAGGKVLKGMVDVYPVKEGVRKVNLDIGYVSRLLGVKISKKQIIDILKGLGFDSQIVNSGLRVAIPTRRLDVSIPEDLIEDLNQERFQQIKDVQMNMMLSYR